MQQAMYKLFDKVYYVVGDKIGVVTGILYQPGGIQYRVVWDDCAEGWHYAEELTVEGKTFDE